MAHITLQGSLEDPNGSLSIGDQIRFTHNSTTGLTLEGATSVETITPLGNYYIELQYGLVLVEYKPSKDTQFKRLGVATVNATNTATSIPELLNALAPVSSAELIEFQAILANAVTAQVGAETAKTGAETAASISEAFANQLTTSDLIGSIAIFAADVNITTKGYLTSGDGGSGSWVQNGVTGQTPSQNPAQLAGAILNDGNGNQWILTSAQQYPDQLGAGSGDTSGVTDTLTIQAYVNSRSDRDTLHFKDGSVYYIKEILAPCNNKTFFAYGSKFYIVEDGTALNPKVGFNFNPDASPANPEATSQSFGIWLGGQILSNIENPVGIAAFKGYAIRQMVIRDVMMGAGTGNYLTYGIMIAGLGGHKFVKNRFLLVGTAFYCPDWSEGYSSPSIPITTSTFDNNEFTLATGQRAMYVNGGWQRWRIYGGFANGSDNTPVFHFTNNGGSSIGLIMEGVGFEQASAGGHFVLMESTNARYIRALTFNIFAIGDPSAGGFTAVELQNCHGVAFPAGLFEQSEAAGNTSILADAACTGVEVSSAVNFSQRSIVYNSGRRTISLLPSTTPYPNLSIAGYQGNSFSSGVLNVDIKSAIGGDYPQQLMPTGYTLLVQARDSGSSSSAFARVELFSSSTSPSVERNVVDLRGVNDSDRVSGSMLIYPNSDGSIDLQVFASGVSTLDLWVFVTAIHQ